MKKMLRTLLVALVASAILAAPGEAAKPVYSIACTVGTGGMTTLTWISGTTGADIRWFNSSDALIAETLYTVTSGNGPGSDSVDTPAGSATATVTFSGRRPARLAPVACMAV